MIYFKVLHDIQYQKIWRTNVPEVFHFDQNAATKLTKAWQELIMKMNPGMTGRGFRSLLRYDRAFTNFTGFDYPKHSPRADFINEIDVDAQLPYFDKCRICGGAVVRGVLNGNTLTVETLDGSKPPPTVAYVMSKPWLYFKAITVKEDGSNSNFPQNGGKPIYIPLVATGRVTVSINTVRLKTPYPFMKRVY
jgi:hypothetical protein